MNWIAREPVLIRKAAKKPGRKPWKVTRTQKRLEALSKNMSNAVGISLIKGLKTFKSRVSKQAIYDAWLSKDYSKIIAITPWDKFSDDLAPFRDALGDASGEFADFAIDALPLPVSELLRYDTANPRVQSFIDKRVGELIVNVSTDQQKIVQEAISRSLDEAMTPDIVAGIIKDSIGLLPRQEAALRNMSKDLLYKGRTAQNVQAITGEYADRLLQQRAMTIARTEVQTTMNAGQLAVWREASNQGLLDVNTARKVWLTDGEPCEICDPMDGVDVGLWEAWSLENGDVVDYPNEAHPNCMCTMTLDIGETQDAFEANQPEEDNG